MLRHGSFLTRAVIIPLLLIALITPGGPIPETVNLSQNVRADPLNTTVYHSWDEMVIALNQITVEP